MLVAGTDLRGDLSDFLQHIERHKLRFGLLASLRKGDDLIADLLDFNNTLQDVKGRLRARRDKFHDLVLALFELLAICPEGFDGCIEIAAGRVIKAGAQHLHAERVQIAARSGVQHGSKRLMSDKVAINGVGAFILHTDIAYAEQ